ncbi:PREDICTED: uncharacterized protein LOC107880916 [Prunus mume]|uniref:Uncharacterized protein LOC107880916 n=1 Tax=Prunus mume TaxID=102107 RepID=A0ABM1LNG4_PRUMU|nr:PREDICTED: uncharacterized protein LOC107880916 [Prunus mume]
MVSIKLQAGNYLLWKNLFLHVLRKYKLIGLLTGADPPLLRTIINAVGCIVDNPALDLWYDKDQSLMIWIISTLLTDLLSHTCLQNLVKGDLSMVSYLQQMKEIDDGLGDAGHPLTDDDLVAYILADLSEEYDSFVTFIETHREKVSFDELHGFLLGREAAILKHKLRSNSFGPIESFHAYAATPRSSQHFSHSRGSNNSNSQHRGFPHTHGLLLSSPSNFAPNFSSPPQFGAQGFHSPNFSRNSSHGGGNSNPGGSSSFNSADFSFGLVLVCQFYNKKGHAANTCRKLGRLFNVYGSSSSGPFTGYYANPQSAASSSSWIVDSEFMQHLLCNNDIIHNLLTRNITDLSKTHNLAHNRFEFIH